MWPVAGWAAVRRDGRRRGSLRTVPHRALDVIEHRIPCSASAHSSRHESGAVGVGGGRERTECCIASASRVRHAAGIGGPRRK
jgi:hypothetical protein